MRQGVVLKIPFGVPLNPDGKAFGSWQVNALDYIIGRSGLDHQPVCQSVNALAMQSIDHDLGFARQFFKHAVRRQVDQMT